MVAPFRIKRNGGLKNVAAKGAGDDFKSYLDRLLKMIPAEVIGLYLVGSGFIPQDQPVVLVVWSILCLFGVVAVRAYGTTDPMANQTPEWAAVWIAVGAFVIWVYTIGGPFKQFRMGGQELHQPYIGSLLVLAYTFFIPIFYKDK